MPDNTDFLMLPVMLDKCHYESLLNGTLTLVDIARLHDAISVMDENARRLSEASK
jgi:Family of unknown function (DUF6889)